MSDSKNTPPLLPFICALHPFKQGQTLKQHKIMVLSYTPSRIKCKLRLSFAFSFAVSFSAMFFLVNSNAALRSTASAIINDRPLQSIGPCRTCQKSTVVLSTSQSLAPCRTCQKSTTQWFLVCQVNWRGAVNHGSVHTKTPPSVSNNGASDKAGKKAQNTKPMPKVHMILQSTNHTS